TAHYCWRRSASLLGIGRDNFLKVAVDEQFRTSAQDLERVLESCRIEHRPVIQIVSVLGTTEFGSVDPIDELMD
ncbi:MAG: pyridoxal-dependent decarboxylase, partial [Rhodothermales bacterium]